MTKRKKCRSDNCQVLTDDGKAIFCSSHKQLEKTKPKGKICKEYDCNNLVVKERRIACFGWCKEHLDAWQCQNYGCSNTYKDSNPKTKKWRRGLCNKCYQRRNQKKGLICKNCRKQFGGQGLQCHSCRYKESKKKDTYQANYERTQDECRLENIHIQCRTCDLVLNNELSLDEINTNWKWRKDLGKWKNECRDCYNSKKLSTFHYRKNKLNPAFLLQCAKRSERRRISHPEESVEYNRRRVEDLKDHWRVLKYNFIKCSGVDENDTVTLEGLYEMFQKDCYYCGVNKSNHRYFNGIDRVIPFLPYNNLKNCVPCCRDCNYMKCNRPMDQFIHSIRAIYNNLDTTKIDSDLRVKGWFGYGQISFSPTLKRMDLNIDEQAFLRKLCCYLCGKENAGGIDRVDSTGHYTYDNCKACCSNCNFLKRELSLDGFLAQCYRINEKTKYWILKDFKTYPSFKSNLNYKIRCAGLY